MPAAVIFDLDGTLMDTIEDLYFAMNDMLAEMKFPAITRAQVRKFIGNGALEFVRLSLPEGTDDRKIGECYDVYRRIYDNNSTSRSRVYGGILPLLGALKRGGCKLAVLSNKPDFATQGVISNFFSGTFDFVSGQRAEFLPKPDPACAEFVLKQLGVPPERAVIVGDGETDYLTANACGIKCVSVLWGYRTREELAVYGAKVFAETPEELLRILQAD